MAKSVEVNLGGVFFPLLALLFVALKLTGVIAWSWWWVLAPLWGPVAVVAIILTIFAIVLGIAATRGSR